MVVFLFQTTNVYSGCCVVSLVCLSKLLSLLCAEALSSWLYSKITVITSQSGCGVVRWLETGLRDADLVSLRRLLVVQILTGADWGHDSSSPEATPAETDGKFKKLRISGFKIFYKYFNCDKYVC